MDKEIYDFGSNLEEVAPDASDAPADDVTDVTDAPADDVTPADNVTPNGDDAPADDAPADAQADVDDIQDDLDAESAALDKELSDLEKLLGEDEGSEWSNIKSNPEVSEKLQDSVKTIKTLMGKVQKLELEKAEMTKFWESAWLSPEMIIMKAHYDKAKKWDEASINKIKELMASDLGLEVTNQKQVFVSSAISRDTDVNTGDEERGFGAWFTM